MPTSEQLPVLTKIDEYEFIITGLGGPTLHRGFYDKEKKKFLVIELPIEGVSPAEYGQRLALNQTRHL